MCNNKQKTVYVFWLKSLLQGQKESQQQSQEQNCYLPGLFLLLLSQKTLCKVQYPFDKLHSYVMNCIYNAHFMASFGHFLLICLSQGMFLTLHSSQWLLNNNTKMFFSPKCRIYRNFFGWKERPGNTEAYSSDRFKASYPSAQGGRDQVFCMAKVM